MKLGEVKNHLSENISIAKSALYIKEDGPINGGNISGRAYKRQFTVDPCYLASCYFTDTRH